MNLFIQSGICLAVLTLFVFANGNNETLVSQELITSRGNNVLSERGCQNNIYDVYDDKYMFFDNSVKARTFCGLHIHFRHNKVCHVKIYTLHPDCEKEKFIYKNKILCGQREHNFIITQTNSGFISYHALQNRGSVHVNVSITFKNIPTTRAPTTHFPKGCGYDIYSSTNIYVNYLNNLNCKWTIRNNNYRYVIIQVEAHIEDQQYCEYDYLSFNSIRGKELNKICGPKKYFKYIYTDLREIIFKTDGDTILNHFHISVIFSNYNLREETTRRISTKRLLINRLTTRKHLPGVIGCDGRDKIFYGTDGEIIINNAQYKTGMDCTWIAKRRKNYYIVVRFLRFDIENSTQCIYDSFKVNDKKYCGKINNQPEHKFIGTDVNLAFKTDERIESNGIHIQIQYIREH